MPQNNEPINEEYQDQIRTLTEEYNRLRNIYINDLTWARTVEEETTQNQENPNAEDTPLVWIENEFHQQETDGNYHEEDDYPQDEEVEEEVPSTPSTPYIGEYAGLTRLPDEWQINTWGERYIYLNVEALFRQNGLRVRAIFSEDSIFIDSYRQISEWAQQNDLKLFIGETLNYRFDINRNGAFTFPIISGFAWYREDEAAVDNTHNPRFNCSVKICECGTENPFMKFICQNEECKKFLYCVNCQSWDTNNINWDVFDGRTYCSNCGVLCERCEDRYHEGNNYNACADCEERFNCPECGEYRVGERHPIELRNTEEEWEVEVCNSCVDNYCIGCFQFRYHDDWNENEEGNRVCRRCYLIGTSDTEDWDADAEMAATNLSIPVIEGREMIRMCGVELEGANRAGGQLIAAQLYDVGLSYSSVIEGYHAGDNGFAHVERDSSVDWELVMGPMNMANIEHVRNLNKCVKLVRQTIKDGHAKLDLRCGVHIHVSAEQVGLHQAYNLHILYMYLEDILYRLGAAKWPIHRSLVQGDRHCAKSEKMETKMSFANMYRDNRYYGLSFSNYFNQMINGCECGARRYGLWEECTCRLNKCTFEFRLFNTTANTTKLHAYLALTQALVAKATLMPEIRNTDDYPALDFISKRFKDMGVTEQESLLTKWKKRIPFLVNELPLTEEEKDSIYYCIMNSELETIGNLYLEEREVTV